MDLDDILVYLFIYICFSYAKESIRFFHIFVYDIFQNFVL